MEASFGILMQKEELLERTFSYGGSNFQILLFTGLNTYLEDKAQELFSQYKRTKI